MRFVKGVVDSEDIPLNLSRELLQDSAQIRKLRTVITNKFLRFLQDKAKKEERSFMEFYKDYGFFLKEGILSGTDQVKNLCFEYFSQRLSILNRWLLGFYYFSVSNVNSYLHPPTMFCLLAVLIWIPLSYFKNMLYMFLNRSWIKIN